jgi:hypothetical protein
VSNTALALYRIGDAGDGTGRRRRPGRI